MNLQDTAMDNMNRIATDILECESCSSEDVTVTGSHYDDQIGSTATFFLCTHCGHTFTDYS